MNDAIAIRNMLTTAKTIAVVGLSDDPARASHSVSLYMQNAGYRILPVNPMIQSALGEQAYASLTDLPIRPDIVNVFRLPRAISPIVDEMIALGLKQLWVQLGIRNEEAARRAEEARFMADFDPEAV